VRIATLGDLLLDVIVRLDEPLSVGADAAAHIRTGAGGQAANVAAWCASLGAEACFVGKRSTDTAGRLVRAELEGHGVEVLGPEVSEGSGVVVSVVTPDGERTMASDRGVAPLLRAEEIDVRWFRGVDVLHIAGYSLLRRPIDEASARAAGAARAQGARISVDLSSWTAIRDYGADAFRRRLEQLEPDLLLANEDENEVMGGDLPAPSWVVKRGPAGAVASRGGERIELPAEPAEVVDATGAGDAFTAGFLLGGTLEEATRRGLATAARCLSQPGAMPS
jgi:ribokinase